jgi:hypothetical protein
MTSVGFWSFNNKRRKQLIKKKKKTKEGNKPRWPSKYIWIIQPVGQRIANIYIYIYKSNMDSLLIGEEYIDLSGISLKAFQLKYLLPVLRS